MAQKKKNKKSPVQKGKVTVSPLGLITLCGGVIICCLLLLLGTTIIEGRRNKITQTEIQTEKTQTQKKQPEKKQDAAKVSQNTIVENKDAEIEKTKTQTGEITIDLKELKTSKTSTPVKAETNKTQSQTKTPAQTNISVKETGTEKTGSKAVEPQKPVPEKTAETKIENKKTETEVKTETQKNLFGFPAAQNNAQLCILLDDGGQNLDDLKKFLALKIPLTVAVLPKLRDSVSSANAARSAGCEVMLHQPMQAVNLNVNPGPGAIKPDMNSDQIKNLVLENLKEVGPVAGMNNHEGSLITADISKMETVLNIAHMQGIYFLDSRTNVETKIPYVSREMGYGWYERNGYFLDNQKTRDEFLKELRKNLDIANKTGCVIMIAHVWSANYMPDLIREVYPELVAKGYSFRTVGKSRGLKN